MKDTASENFKDTMRLTMDTIQVMKYQLEWFKANPIHKEVAQRGKNLDMRPDITALQGAIQTFLFNMQKKCTPETFRGIMRLMTRDKLHDLSLHQQVMYEIDNVEDVTNLFKEIISETKEQTELSTTQNAAS